MNSSVVLVTVEDMFRGVRVMGVLLFGSGCSWQNEALQGGDSSGSGTRWVTQSTTEGPCLKITSDEATNTHTRQRAGGLHHTRSACTLYIRTCGCHMRLCVIPLLRLVCML